MKLGVQPDRVLQSMLNDRMVAKGLILQYATTFFQDYLSSESIDDLVALLRKARLDTHLLDLFPPQKRTLKDLDEHFKVGPADRSLGSRRALQSNLDISITASGYITKKGARLSRRLARTVLQRGIVVSSNEGQLSKG